MDLSSDRSAPDDMADILGRLHGKGIRLWCEQGQLRYRAPKGALSRHDVESLRIHRSQLIALLNEANVGAHALESTLQPRRHCGPAPLAFSQLAHWRISRLGERPAIRQISAALRLRGRIDVGTLQSSLDEVVRRHDALRTRIVIADGTPVQEILEHVECPIVVDDLTGVPELLRDAEVLSRIERHILEPIDLRAAPLFGIRLLRLHADEHVLVLAMEHMISDARSRDILLRELFAAYAQAVGGHAFSLPPVQIQFSDYTTWQREMQEAALSRRAEYCNQRAKAFERVRFPRDGSPGAAVSGWTSVPVYIDKALRTQLQDWCRFRRTTLVMAIFAAYAALVLRWCGVSRAVVQYATDGRFTPKLENTIGFLASGLYVDIQVPQDSSLDDLLAHVVAQYCQAWERADFSYTAAQVPVPEFTRSTGFNWISRPSSRAAAPQAPGALECSAVRFANPLRATLDVDNEPYLLLVEGDEDIVGDVCFGARQFSFETMERFARSFVALIEALVRTPHARLRDVALAD